MSFLKKLFQGNKPTEPIFPGENFSIIKLSLPDGLAFATVNKAYENYPNKSFFPWLAGLEIQVLDKNENGHPSDSEAIVLNQIQEDFEGFLKNKHTVHSIVRVTRNGFRDLLIYIDKPRLKQEEVDAFFEDIKKIEK
jgi:hypothetical protein